MKTLYVQSVVGFISGQAIRNWQDPVWRRIFQVQPDVIQNMARNIPIQENWRPQAHELMVAYLVANDLYERFQKQVPQPKEAVPLFPPDSDLGLKEGGTVEVHPSVGLAEISPSIGSVIKIHKAGTELAPDGDVARLLIHKIGIMPLVPVGRGLMRILKEEEAGKGGPGESGNPGIR